MLPTAPAVSLPLVSVQRAHFCPAKSKPWLCMMQLFQLPSFPTLRGRSKVPPFVTARRCCGLGQASSQVPPLEPWNVLGWKGPLKVVSRDISSWSWSLRVPSSLTLCVRVCVVHSNQDKSQGKITAGFMLPMGWCFLASLSSSSPGFSSPPFHLPPCFHPAGESLLPALSSFLSSPHS